MKYRRIAELGVTVHEEPIDHVKHDDLNAALRKACISGVFNKFFGIQTCLMDGPYASDVEAVLERIATGRLTGSQEYPD